MTDKASTSALAGFTVAETIVMAAAYYHSRSADIDFDRVVAHVGSKSVQSVRERLRLAKKKQIDVQLPPSKITTTTAPSGGVDKKSPGKVNKSPRKANKVKPIKSEESEKDTIAVEA